MLWFLLACGGGAPVGSAGPTASPSTTLVASPTSGTAGPSTVPGPQLHPTGPTASTGSTGATGDTGLALPGIADALAGRCDLSKGFGEPAPDAAGDLFRLAIDGGRCNDGTEPVAYVRAATDPAHVDDWMVFLEGGGRCTSGEECAVRWCGEDFHDARMMSTAWAGSGMLGKGVSSSASFSAFAAWNQVYVPYCSSDEWAGQASDVPLVTDDGTAYRMHFEGALVVEALFDQLQAGATSDDGSQVLPALGGAGRLVFSGSSAGGSGVMTHLDALADRLHPMAVVGVIDGMSGPDPTVLPAADAAALTALARSNWDDVVLGLYGATADADCFAAAEPWQCTFPSTLQRDLLSTPFFLHFDLRDARIQALYRQLIGLADGAFVEGSAATLHQVADAQPAAGVFGTQCGEHVTLSSDTWLHQQTLAVDGVPMSVHDAVLAWLEGVPVVAIDDPRQPTTVCP